MAIQCDNYILHLRYANTCENTNFSSSSVGKYNLQKYISTYNTMYFHNYKSQMSQKIWKLKQTVAHIYCQFCSIINIMTKIELSIKICKGI